MHAAPISYVVIRPSTRYVSHMSSRHAALLRTQTAKSGSTNSTNISNMLSARALFLPPGTGAKVEPKARA